MVYSEDMATDKKDTGTGILPGFEEYDFGEEIHDDIEVDDESEDQIKEDVVEKEDNRTTSNRKTWSVLNECLHARGIQWTDVARQLNVPISSINSRRKYGRDIEFGFLVSLLDMLGCTLRLTIPAPSVEGQRHSFDVNKLSLALREMLRVDPNKTQSLLPYEKTGTSEIVDVCDKLSAEDQRLVYVFALRLKNGKMSDNDMRQLYAPVKQKKGKRNTG